MSLRGPRVEEGDSSATPTAADGAGGHGWERWWRMKEDPANGAKEGESSEAGWRMGWVELELRLVTGGSRGREEKQESTTRWGRRRE